MCKYIFIIEQPYPLLLSNTRIIISSNPVLIIRARIIQEICNVKGNINGTEQPVKNIVVQLYNDGSSESKDVTTTDSDGWYEFRGLAEGTYTLKFSDTDGDANGGSFAQKEHSVTLKDDFNYSPTLDNAN